MSFQVIFNVDGDPQGKARARFTKTGRAYTPQKTVNYENEIADKAKQAMGSSEPLETPVAVYVYADYAIPSSYSNKLREACLNGFERPTKKPDADNICKAVCDALNKIVYKDDAQVVSLHFTKRYNSVAGIQVLVREELA